jgi:hypothetical protein
VNVAKTIVKWHLIGKLIVHLYVFNGKRDEMGIF